MSYFTQTLPTTEARKNLFEITGSIQKNGGRYMLTRHGRPAAALISIEELESWIETVEVMAICPNLKEEMDEAQKEYEMGLCTPLEDVLSKEGLLVRDASDAKYDASGNSEPKGKKGARKAPSKRKSKSN